MTKKNYNYPVIAFTNGIILTSVLTLGFYTKRIKKIYYDPHVWMPQKNRNPWKNKINDWCHNEKLWINTKPWKNDNPWTK